MHFEGICGLKQELNYPFKIMKNKARVSIEVCISFMYGQYDLKDTVDNHIKLASVDFISFFILSFYSFAVIVVVFIVAVVEFLLFSSSSSSFSSPSYFLHILFLRFSLGRGRRLVDDGVQVWIDRGVDGEYEHHQPGIDVGGDGDDVCFDEDTQDNDGHPTEEVRADYEEELKGHLDLVRRFPLTTDLATYMAYLEYINEKVSRICLLKLTMYVCVCVYIYRERERERERECYCNNTNWRKQIQESTINLDLYVFFYSAHHKTGFQDTFLRRK